MWSTILLSISILGLCSHPSYTYTFLSKSLDLPSTTLWASSPSSSTSSSNDSSDPKRNGVWALSGSFSDDSKATPFETSQHQCKKLVEFACDNGKCVPLSRYCDGNDDCGDQSDEQPLACTNCNRTLYGHIGLKYPLRLTEPFQRFQPFICKVTFAAAGDEYGDIVELTFLSFQIGSFEVAKNQSAGCYSGHVILEEQNHTISSQNTGYSSNQPILGYSDEMLTFKKKENVHKQYPLHDEDEEFTNKMMSSSASTSLQFGRFCGQMSVRSATYFSERNNVSLIIYVPSRASVLTYSFSLYLTYKFLPSRPAVTRFGPPSDPFELGIKLSGTYCDRVFDDCSASKKCKIRSPNWPGFYNRNITCKFWIKHYSPVPVGHKARIIVSQNNEYKISLYTDPSSSSDSSQTSLQSDCPYDVVRIYDGQTTQSPVLIEFCGSGVLPSIVTSRPEMLVVLKSAPNQILYNSRLELNVAVELSKVHESSDAIERTGACDFVYDATKIRSGLIETPKHSIPSNTTCTFKLVSPNSSDRVWLYFMSYFVQDKHHWSNQELCDVSRLEIYDYVLMSPKSNDTSVHYQQKQRLYSYCEKTSPKICGRAADAKNYLPSNPCTYPNESYLSGSSELVIKQEYYKHYDLYVRRGSFAARFEFIDTHQVGNQIDDKLCDREITSLGKYFKGRITSPKNLFLYGRGGRENISCSYYLKGTNKQRIRIVFDTIRMQSLSCEQLFDPKTNQYQCRIIHNNNNNINKNGPKVALLTLYDTIGSERIKIGCLCNAVTNGSPLVGLNPKTHPNIVFDMISSDVVLNFSLTRMSPFEDFNDYGFDASFEFLPAFDCDSGGLVQRRNGSEGEIQYSVPQNYNFERDGPLKCRWIIEAAFGKHLFLKFKGHLANTKNSECLNGNRFVVYAGNPRRPIATICTNRAKTLFNANVVTNQLEEFDLFSLSWYNESDSFTTFTANEIYTNYYEVKIFIEIMAFETGIFSMRWLEVTKPFLKTQTGKTMRNINCKVECPEINACISDELVCDGISHCPSSYDESPQFCNRFPTLYVVTIGSLIILSSIVIILLIAIYRFNERRRSRLRQNSNGLNDTRCNQRDSDYVDYPEYPRLGSELNFRSIQECHQIQYQDNGMPMEITRSFVPHYHNNVF